MQDKEAIIEKLGLIPHPEGGYYKETYRGKTEISQDNLGVAYDGSRNTATMIYYLLTADTFSAFHRIIQDEAWHFYNGSTIHLHCISPVGIHTEHRIGLDFEKGEVPQLMVEGGDWFAASIIEGGDYALVGCTVSPGFDFRDFDLADRSKLTAQFPAHTELIKSYTRID